MKNKELGVLLLGLLVFYQSGCLPKLCATYGSNYLVKANKSKLQASHSRQDDIFFSYLSQTDSLPRQDGLFKSKELRYNGLVKRRINVAGLFIDRYSDYQGNRRKIVRAYPRYPVPLAEISSEPTDSSGTELALNLEDTVEELGEEVLIAMSIDQQRPTIFNPSNPPRDSLVFAPKNMDQAMYEIRFGEDSLLTKFLDLKYGKTIEPEAADTSQFITDTTTVEKRSFFRRLFKRKPKNKEEDPEEPTEDEEGELIDDEG